MKNSFLIVFSWVLLPILSALGAGRSHAAPPTDLATTPAAPTEIQTGVYLIDLVKISGAEQLFTADIAMLFK